MLSGIRAIQGQFHGPQRHLVGYENKLQDSLERFDDRRDGHVTALEQVEPDAALLRDVPVE
jgi:hypothetical protein